jgi:hypothetical protein
VGGKHNKCCCDRDCLWFRDTFDRADALTLGPRWDHEEEAWEIFDQRARVVIPDEPAIITTPHPVPDGSMVVRVKTYDEQEGDVYDVLVNVVDDQNFYFARFTRNGTSDSSLSLHNFSSGVETTLRSETIISLTGTEREILVHIGEGEFCASVSFAVISGVVASAELKINGYYAGMRGSREGLTFDDFRAYEHFATNQNCSYCACTCGGTYIPPVLMAYLSGTGRMTGLDCEIILRWDRVSSYWEGSIECCGTTWTLILNCDTSLPGDPLEMSLLVQTPSQACTVSSGGDDPRFPASGSCDPFTLEFGPYNVTDGDLACTCGEPFTTGTWSVTITAAP